MKRLIILLACAWPLAAWIAPPSHAQITVYDPANHAQNILQAARALQELDNQLRQLAHEIEMLENMARNLETLPVNVAQAIIRDRILRIDELLRQAEGIGLRVDDIDGDYDDLYPGEYGDTVPSHAELVAAARERWRQSRAAWRHALSVSAAALEGNQADSAAIERLATLSQDAIGQLQATQAGNQLSAITAQQLIQMEAMLAAHQRADAMQRARELAEAERGRARLQSFLGE